MKTCTKCREPKLLDAFPKRKTAKDGRRGECRDCTAKSRDTPEYKAYMADYLKEYAKENKPVLDLRKKNWYAENRELTLRRSAEWYRAHPERVRVRQQADYQKNRVRIRIVFRAWYVENAAKCREYSRLWKKNNPAAVATYDLRRRVRGGPRPSKARIEALRRETNCAYCGRAFFSLGGRAGSVITRRNIDHVVPICKGGKNDDDNFVAACGRCNLSKHGKQLAEWVAFGAPAGARRLLEERQKLGLAC